MDLKQYLVDMPDFSLAVPPVFIICCICVRIGGSLIQSPRFSARTAALEGYDGKVEKLKPYIFATAPLPEPFWGMGKE